MKIIRQISLIASLLLVISSCDIIEAPYLENPVSALPADEQCIELAAATDPFEDPIVRKVLVEEMTGHKCGNCPEVGELIHAFKTGEFSDQMVVMTIHAGALSTPSNADKYTTDFRTSEGQEMYQEMNPFDVVPLGLIDRTELITGAGAYQSKIQQALDQAPEAGIRVFNCFDADSLKLTTVVDIKYLVEGGDNEHVAVYLIEDKVVDWQKDYRLSDPDIAQYTHHDVLRDAINGTWGVPISDEPITADSRYTKTYTFSINENWNPVNCKVVAIVFDNDTKEVRQVEEAFVIN